MKKMQVGIVFSLWMCSMAMSQDVRPTLREAIAEADRLDPGWTLADLIAKQPRIADAENSALVIATLDNDLSKVWKRPESEVARPEIPAEPTSLDDLWLDIHGLLRQPERETTEGFVRLLKTHEARFAPLVLRARALEQYKSGRSPVRCAFDPNTTDLSHVRQTRAVGQLLAIDGYIRAIHGDVDGGLQSARAILGAGRAFGDEPFLASQATRFSLQQLATDLIVFGLSKGDASEPALAATQAAVANEQGPSQLLILLRGERAVDYDVCDKVAAGKLDIKSIVGEDPKKQRPDGIERPEHRASQAIVLHMMTTAVEIAKNPPWRQVKLWDDWEQQVVTLTKDPAGDHDLVLMLPAAFPAFPFYARAQSLLVAAETVIGFERIRLARHRWPKPGDPLLPAFPNGIPLDPCSGNAVLWKATEAELLVYSVGLNQKDDGGQLENERLHVPRTDFGYRLKKEASASPRGR